MSSRTLKTLPLNILKMDGKDIEEASDTTGESGLSCTVEGGQTDRDDWGCGGTCRWAAGFSFTGLDRINMDEVCSNALPGFSVSEDQQNTCRYTWACLGLCWKQHNFITVVQTGGWENCGGGMFWWWYRAVHYWLLMGNWGPVCIWSDQMKRS